MKTEVIDTVETEVIEPGAEERVRRAIEDAQRRRDTPLNGGVSMELEDFEPPVITQGISYAGEDPSTVTWRPRQSAAMVAFVNRPA